MKKGYLASRLLACSGYDDGYFSSSDRTSDTFCAMQSGRGVIDYSFGILSAAFLGATYLFSKVALREMNTRSFLVFWMLIGGVYAALTCVLRRHGILAHGGFTWLGLLGLGLLEIVTSYAFFTAIRLAPQPAVVAFLAQFSIVFSLVLSVLVLKEHLTAKPAFGALLVIIGNLALSYASGPIGWVLVVLMGIATVTLAISLLLSKIVVQHSDPLLMLVFRNLVTAVGAFLVLPGPLQFPALNLWVILATGAFFGPFCGFLFRYMALARIDAWMVAVFAMTVPLFVSTYDWLFLGNLLTPPQILAGFLVLSGALLVSKTSLGTGLTEAGP